MKTTDYGNAIFFMALEPEPVLELVLELVREPVLEPVLELVLEPVLELVLELVLALELAQALVPGSQELALWELLLAVQSYL